MPYIESTAYKDSYVDFYRSGVFNGTAPDLYVGQKGTNQYITLIAFNALAIPQWSKIQKVEIMLVGADYVDGKTSGDITIAVIKEKWNENEDFRLFTFQAPINVDWSPTAPGVTYSFDVTKIAEITGLREFFDGGIMIAGGVMGSNGSPGLLKFRSRESGSPPILRVTYESDTTPPTCTGGTPSSRFLSIAPNGTFRVEVTGVSDNWSGVQKVQFPTWTEANGQDDIRWYEGVNAGNGTWYYDVPIANHGNAEGKYLTHVYAWDNAGNSANIRVIDTYVDRTPPTVASVQGYSYSNQTGGARRVWIYGAADAISGIAAVEAHYVKAGMNWNGPHAAGQSGSDFYFDAPVYAGDGEYLVHFYLRDRAGNQSGPHEVRFFVDSKRANDPNVSVADWEAAVNFTWLQFSDPAPSSGYDRTLFYLGEWTGMEWVSGAPNLFNGAEIARDINVIEKFVPNIKPGVRYRYTVTHYDKAGNESAYTWREFVAKKRIWTVKFQTGRYPLTLRVYDPESGVPGSKALRISTPAGIGCFELVGMEDSHHNNFMTRIQTSQGTKTIKE
ncbi:GBS Bsp-like repeat-containing protein [Paenibacillus elgii]